MWDHKHNASWVKNIEAISFDFGETLFSYTGNSEEFKVKEGDFILELFEKCGIRLNIPPKDLVIRFREVYWNKIKDNFAQLRDDPDLVPRFKEFLDQHGIGRYEDRIINEMAAAYGNFRFSPTTLKPYPITKKVLEYLIEKSLPIIIISNIPSRGAPHSADFIQFILEKYELREFFGNLIYSGDIGVLKPHPKIFQVAEQWLKISPSHILHIGDNWEADIGGAKSRGWHTFWLSYGKPVPKEFSLADGIGNDLEDFFRWFKKNRE